MSQSEDFYAILDDCVSRLRQGESPEACLADYPSYSGELAPDLALTAELIHLSRLEPSPAAVAAGYQNMMAAFDAQGDMSPLASFGAFVGRLVASFKPPQGRIGFSALRFAAIALVILVVAGGFVITAAADTLPGDALYPVKRSWENARLSLTMDESSRAALRSEFERRRREEVMAVQDLQRPVVVEFSGVVESIDGGLWLVDGLELMVTDDTQVQGAINIGQRVAVRAQVGDDGSLYALVIVVEDNRPGQRPTSTPTPRPTQTSRSTVPAIETRGVVAPSPTPSPEKTRPEPTPTATRKVNDRLTPEPTSTPTRPLDVEPTREPTREPTPTSTPSTDSLATLAPRATNTPVKAEPTPTSRPVDLAPTPTATSTPDRDKVPTPTPTKTRNTDTEDPRDRPP